MLTFEKAQEKISEAFGPISVEKEKNPCPRCGGRLMQISVNRGHPDFKIKELQVWQAEHSEDYFFYYAICADCSHVPAAINLGRAVATNSLSRFNEVEESQL